MKEKLLSEIEGANKAIDEMAAKINRLIGVRDLAQAILKDIEDGKITASEVTVEEKPITKADAKGGRGAKKRV